MGITGEVGISMKKNTSAELINIICKLQSLIFFGSEITSRHLV